MRELLEELYEMDYKTYEEIYNTLRHFEISPDRGGAIVNDLIQGCIQRAIAARGWAWMTKLHFSCTYNAEIYWKTGKTWKNHGGIAHFGDSPAKAILSVYLAAIRSQP